MINNKFSILRRDLLKELYQDETTSTTHIPVYLNNDQDQLIGNALEEPGDAGGGTRTAHPEILAHTAPVSAYACPAATVGDCSERPLGAARQRPSGPLDTVRSQAVEYNAASEALSGADSHSEEVRAIGP